MKHRRLLRSGRLQAAPCVKRVVDLELMVEVFQVVGEAQAVPVGDGVEAAGHRVGVFIAADIGRVHDFRQAEKPGIFQLVFPDEGLERAAFAIAVFPVVPEFDAGSVEGDGARVFNRPLDLARGNEQEFGFAVDETRYQPWAGDTVYLDMRTGDPFHSFFPFLLLKFLMIDFADDSGGGAEDDFYFFIHAVYLAS